MVEEEIHCGHGDLLGPLGLFVQGLLAFIAFSSLISTQFAPAVESVKRFCEPKHERRTWRIWFFDTSKQAVGASIIHFGNVFLADVFQGDPCTWYFISFLLDSTLGLAIIYIGLKISQVIAFRYKWKSLILGDYGTPPKCVTWVLQCCLYVIVMIIEKALMTLLVLFNFWKTIREVILAPIKSPELEIVLVMFVVPVIVNAIIFWVVDNFLKKKAFNSKLSVSAVSNGQQQAMRYNRANNRVQCYDPANTDPALDTLLSISDEENGSCDANDGDEALLTNENRKEQLKYDDCWTVDDDDQLLLDSGDLGIAQVEVMTTSSQRDSDSELLHAVA